MPFQHATAAARPDARSRAGCRRGRDLRGAVPVEPRGDVFRRLCKGALDACPPPLGSGFGSRFESGFGPGFGPGFGSGGEDRPLAVASAVGPTPWFPGPVRDADGPAPSATCCDRVKGLRAPLATQSLLLPT